MAFRQACPLHYGAWRLFDLHRNAIFGKQIAILCDPNWPIERTGKDHQPDGRHSEPATFFSRFTEKIYERRIDLSITRCDIADGR
jgi:hypothetical protein